MTDVLVVGAGPAGLAGALYAARAGLAVTVLERRRNPPLDKACGEGLMPSALAALSGLGVDPAGHGITGIRYLSDSVAVGARFPADALGRGVRRTVLSAALRAAVEASGIEVVEGAVTGLEQDGSGVRVAGLRARYLLAADGLHSPVRRALGLDRPVTGSQRYGLRRHFALAPWTSSVEVHWGPAAEAYLTPVGPNCVGLAVLTAQPSRFEDLLAAFPALRDRLDGREASDALGAGPLRQRSVRRVAGRVLLAGDAAGYVDALTGEGIAVGLATARAAVDAIAADRPDRYEAAWRRASVRYRWLTCGLLAAAGRPGLRRRLVPTAAAAPALFRAAVGQLAR